MATKVQVVIVLYNLAIDQSPACQSFMKYPIPESMQVLIYDHSTQPQQHSILCKENVTYQHDPRNLGLATAYNEAFNRAKQNQCEWLLVLDQDTSCTSAYLEFAVTNHPDVACVLPKMMDQKQLSPVLADEYIDRTIRYPKEGITKQRVMAINSGTLWSIKFLQEIGGFNEAFPLDFLDHWIFFEVYARRQSVEVTGYTLHHQLSVFAYGSLSTARYRSILTSETRYYTQYETTQFTRHQKQLLLRSAKQFLTLKNRKLWKMTVREWYSLYKGVGK